MGNKLLIEKLFEFEDSNFQYIEKQIKGIKFEIRRGINTELNKMSKTYIEEKFRNMRFFFEEVLRSAERRKS